MVKSAKECMKQKASNSEIYGSMQAVFIEMDATPAVSFLVLCQSNIKAYQFFRGKLLAVSFVWQEALMLTFLK